MVTKPTYPVSIRITQDDQNLRELVKQSTGKSDREIYRAGLEALKKPNI